MFTQMNVDSSMLERMSNVMESLNVGRIIYVFAVGLSRQVDFPAGQVTFHSRLPVWQGRYVLQVAGWRLQVEKWTFKSE